MLLAMRRAGIEREPAAVARYAKTREERACAATRKIRLLTDAEAQPVRKWAVEQVVAGLDETVDVATALELRRVAERLLDVADTKQSARERRG